MHDIDRTQLEAGIDGGELSDEWAFDNQPELYGEMDETYGQMYEDPLGEMDGEFENEEGEDGLEVHLMKQMRWNWLLNFFPSVVKRKWINFLAAYSERLAVD